MNYLINCKHFSNISIFERRHLYLVQVFNQPEYPGLNPPNLC